MTNVGIACDPPPRSRPAPRVGLVLGGGGAIGAAYHAGALAALEHDLGWDARRASVIVGTSAGSLVGALLRRGVPATDLAALAVGSPTRFADPALVTSLQNRPVFPSITLNNFLRRPRRLRMRTLRGLARLAASSHSLPIGALSLLLPEGRVVLAPHLAFLDADSGTAWPGDPLLVCAVRRRDCRLVVFGSEECKPPLSTALAASCAVPGYFAGVNIDQDDYLDGGVISPTNVDVLADRPVDLAIIVSPMSGTSRWPSLNQAIRRVCRKALNREVRTLAKHGVDSVVIEPGPDVLRHMSLDFMSEKASVEIVWNTFLETGAQIRSDSSLRRLAPGASTNNQSMKLDASLRR